MGWLCGEGKWVIHHYDINGDGWVDVIFGEKALLSEVETFPNLTSS
jgi:hypothetical protein